MLTPTAASTCFTNLASTVSWYQNYCVRPYGYCQYNESPPYDPGPSNPVPAGIQFVPSFLDPSHVNTTELNDAEPYAASSGYIITFNEPYGEGATTPAQAIAVWPQLQTMAATANAKLIAPSMGYSDPAARTWLSTFMGLIASNGYHVDVLNYHQTMGLLDGSAGEVGQAQTFFRWLNQLHADFPSYPIWVTEAQFFSSNDSTGVDQILKYWKIGIPPLDADPWVERYAWWPVGRDFTRNPAAPPFDSLSFCDVNGALLQSGINWRDLTFKTP